MTEKMSVAPDLIKVTPEALPEKKKNSLQVAFDQIEAIAGPASTTEEKLAVAKKLLSEVRGKDYFAEGMLAKLMECYAKLIEYYELELEVDNRIGELDRIAPGSRQRIAANDSHFLDIKYKV